MRSSRCSQIDLTLVEQADTEYTTSAQKLLSVLYLHSRATGVDPSASMRATITRPFRGCGNCIANSNGMDRDRCRPALRLCQWSVSNITVRLVTQMPPRGDICELP